MYSAFDEALPREALARHGGNVPHIAASLGVHRQTPQKVRDVWDVIVNSEPHEMYGLIGKMIAAPGQRDALVAILLEGTAGMPGCLSYVIATDPAGPDALWITEVWDSQERHDASLSLPAVRDAITRGRPLIAGFGERIVTTPVGGHGLVGVGMAG